MVGASMACAFGQGARLGQKRLLLIDAGKAPARVFDASAPYGNRVSAISPASRQFFDDMGVWSAMASARVKPVERLQVHESRSKAFIEFAPDEATKAPVAHIVENALIVGALMQRIDDSCPNVDMRFGVKMNDCLLPTSVDEKARLELDDGSSVETDLLVGADGWHSRVRQAVQCEHTAWQYEEKALVATLRLAEPSDNDCAWQRFGAHGPIALLPLDEQHSSLVWTTAVDDADRLVAADGDAFVDELNGALLDDSLQDPTSNRLLCAADAVFGALGLTSSGAAQPPPTIVSVLDGSRASFPLGFGHSFEYAAPRCALVGDAAHRVHPLAGQGANLGFGDACCLVDTLDEALARGADLGAYTHLQRFERRRQTHNAPVMVAIDWLNRLYSYGASPVVAARSLGLDAVNRLGILKRFITWRASV